MRVDLVGVRVRWGMYDVSGYKSEDDTDTNTILS